MASSIMNISIHCTREEDVELKLSEIVEGEVSTYRVLNIGDLPIFLSIEQTQRLFEELDKKLHETTYEQLEEMLNSLRTNNEDLIGTNEHLSNMILDNQEKETA